MIKLTRLDGESFLLNADLIKYVEERPDTFVTLTTGDRVIVQEKMEEVLDRALYYHQSKQLIPRALPSGPSRGFYEASTGGSARTSPVRPNAEN